MRIVRAAVAVVAIAAGACAGEEQWPLPEPCAYEDDERTCRVRTLEIDGVERTFIVSHLRVDDCVRGPLPVVFAWHGTGSNGQELRDYFGVESAQGGARAFVYPDGLARSDADGRTGWELDLDGADVRFFDAMREALRDDACLDQTRVFSVGHSRGGRFVDALGCVRGDVHGAMASVAAGSGNVDASACDTQAPVWLTHGHNDEVVSYREGEQLRDDWARRNGCEVPGWFDEMPTNECTRLAGCDEETVFCPSDVEAWDGHSAPDFAGAEIAAFFARHDAR